MHFYGEFIDTLLDADMQKICSGQTTELKEWIRTHPELRNGYVSLGGSGEASVIQVETYMEVVRR